MIIKRLIEQVVPTTLFRGTVVPRRVYVYVFSRWWSEVVNIIEFSSLEFTMVLARHFVGDIGLLKSTSVTVADDQRSVEPHKSLPRPPIISVAHVSEHGVCG